MLDLLSGESILSHWKSLIAIWVGINVIMSMPSPAATGPTSHWIYKWAFGALHSIAGGVPRIVATMFPQYSKFIPGTNGGAPHNGGPAA
jgi:hypothetical protein